MRLRNSIMPPNAIGKKITESMLSPATVDTIARNEKYLPLWMIFILLMMYALAKDPARNARRLADIIRGANPNTKLKCSAPSQYGAAGRCTASNPTGATMKFMAKAIHMTSVALLKPHT